MIVWTTARMNTSNPSNFNFDFYDWFVWLVALLAKNEKIPPKKFLTPYTDFLQLNFRVKISINVNKLISQVVASVICLPGKKKRK